jgi:hypothetical protein
MSATPGTRVLGATDLLRAHEIPFLQTGLEALQGQGAAGVGLGPAGPQGSQGVGILDIIVEQVAACPLVQLDDVDVGCFLVLDELVDGGQDGTLFGGAVQLRLSTDFDSLMNETDA